MPTETDRGLRTGVGCLAIGHFHTVCHFVFRVFPRSAVDKHGRSDIEVQRRQRPIKCRINQRTHESRFNIPRHEDIPAHTIAKVSGCRNYGWWRKMGICSTHQKWLCGGASNRPYLKAHAQSTFPPGSWAMMLLQDARASEVQNFDASGCFSSRLSYALWIMRIMMGPIDAQRTKHTRLITRQPAQTQEWRLLPPAGASTRPFAPGLHSLGSVCKPDRRRQPQRQRSHSTEPLTFWRCHSAPRPATVPARAGATCRCRAESQRTGVRMRCCRAMPAVGLPGCI